MISIPSRFHLRKQLGFRHDAIIKARIKVISSFVVAVGNRRAGIVGQVVDTGDQFQIARGTGRAIAIFDLAIVFVERVGIGNLRIRQAGGSEISAAQVVRVDVIGFKVEFVAVGELDMPFAGNELV